MKILGINTSHDTSACLLQDGKIVFVHDEARFRREKYWHPHEGQLEDVALMCLQREGDLSEDHLIFASFDRRGLDLELEKETHVFDRLKAEEITEAFRSEQLSRKRLESLGREYKFKLKTRDDDDEVINRSLSDNQLNSRDFYFEREHHLYHAESGHHLSPFKDEDAIAIVWDGGGAQPYYEDYPNFQEMETIYRCTSGGAVTPQKQWQRLSNARWCAELGWTWPNLPYDCVHCWEDVVEERDGAEIIFSSRPSSGMNFSQLSVALGCDELGRGAGKVMGMASYGTTRPNVFNNFTVAQQCEEEALINSLNIIRKAVELNPDVKNIVLSGGYSLNCTNNYKYLEHFPEHNFFVDPIPHDGGTAVGAAVWLNRKLTDGNLEEVTEILNGEDV